MYRIDAPRVEKFRRAGASLAGVDGPALAH